MLLSSFFCHLLGDPLDHVEVDRCLNQEWTNMYCGWDACMDLILPHSRGWKNVRGSRLLIICGVSGSVLGHLTYFICNSCSNPTEENLSLSLSLPSPLMDWETGPGRFLPSCGHATSKLQAWERSAAFPIVCHATDWIHNLRHVR